MSTRDYKRNDVTRVLEKLFVCVAIAGLNQLTCPPLVEGRDAHVRIHVLQPLVMSSITAGPPHASPSSTPRWPVGAVIPAQHYPFGGREDIKIN